MLNPPDKEIFPRPLAGNEKEWIFDALPENKTGYKNYRNKIGALEVIGAGRFGGDNFILGKPGDRFDLEIPTSPVFAVADIEYSDRKIHVVVHEESESQIEIDIRVEPADYSHIKPEGKIVHTISDWEPGKKLSPSDSGLREIHLIKNRLVLVFASGLKRIWIYESETGINHFLPVSNFYNELMRLMGNKNPETALVPDRLFTHLNDFEDEQLGGAFLNYNKYLRRIKIDYPVFELQKSKSNKKSFFGFFNK